MDRSSYQPPVLVRRARLDHVTAGDATSVSDGGFVVKGGCFKSPQDYSAPTLEKREKLNDVTGQVASTSDSITV